MNPAYLPTLPVFLGVSKFFIKSPGHLEFFWVISRGYSWTLSCPLWHSHNAKISRLLQIFVLWGLAGMILGCKQFTTGDKNNMTACSLLGTLIMTHWPTHPHPSPPMAMCLKINVSFFLFLSSLILLFLKINRSNFFGITFTQSKY